MKEIKGNIWDYYDRGNWIVITTNGTVKRNGEAVMGRGVALEAKKRFPRLPGELGRRISFGGNNPYTFSEYKILTLPTKHNWYEKSTSDLIELSLAKLLAVVNNLKYSFPALVGEVYMVRPGCSNGGLNWEDIRLILEKYLDDRFTIVEKE